MPFKELANCDDKLKDLENVSDELEGRSIPTGITTILDEGDSSNSGNARSEDLSELNALANNSSTEVAPASISEVVRERLLAHKK